MRPETATRTTRSIVMLFQWRTPSLVFTETVPLSHELYMSQISASERSKRVKPSPDRISKKGAFLNEAASCITPSRHAREPCKTINIVSAITNKDGEDAAADMELSTEQSPRSTSKMSSTPNKTPTHGTDNRRRLTPYAMLLAVLAALVLIVIFSMYTLQFNKILRSHHVHKQPLRLRDSQRRLRRRGPQPLVCTVGELAAVVGTTFPEDGLCDVIIYTHVTHLVKPKKTYNFQEFLRAAGSASKSRYSISFFIRRCVFKVSNLNIFMDTYTKKNIRGFGMLGTRWNRETETDFYISFMQAIHAYRKAASRAKRIKNVFGFVGIRMSNLSREDPEGFLKMHAPIFKNVQLLIYGTHGEKADYNSNNNCVSSFPTPRVFETPHGEPSLQDGIVAIDTMLHKMGHPVFNVCVSFTLSVHSYRMAGDVDLGKPCRNMTPEAYFERCNAKAAQTTKVDGEGTVVLDDHRKLVSAYDVPDTLQKKLPSLKTSLVYALPGWSPCAAMFHLEHEDGTGDCGEKFQRLRTVKNYLQEMQG